MNAEETIKFIAPFTKTETDMTCAKRFVESFGTKFEVSTVFGRDNKPFFKITNDFGHSTHIERKF